MPTASALVEPAAHQVAPLRRLTKAAVPAPCRRALRAAEARLRDTLWPQRRDATDSYALEGEDMVLRRILHGRTEGFYVDVGAHHPTRFSNTYHFYRRGWRGINIDATPGSMALFQRLRPRDINLEIAISADGSARTFHQFNEPALNGFDPRTAVAHQRVPGYWLVGRRSLPSRRLDAVLDEYLAPGLRIDFLNVDVEGMDLEVLASNDWNRHRPLLVLVEVHAPDLESLGTSPVVAFLRPLDYRPHARTPSTLILRRGD